MECLQCQNIKDETELFKLKCQHLFCWTCINDYLKENLNPKIKCPFQNCSKFLKDFEIRRVLSDDDITLYEKKCLNSTKKTHKCLLEQCDYYLIYTDDNIQFQCPICQLYNCISCKASHSFMTCKIYKLKNQKEKDKINEEENKNAQEILIHHKAKENREMILTFYDTDLLKNDKIITCTLCDLEVGKNDGIMLQNCFHSFCRDCLENHVKNSKIPIECPSCSITINDGEIQKILTEDDLLLYQDKLIYCSKSSLDQQIQCQTPDCNTLYHITGKVDEFKCRKCGKINCIKCRAIHQNENCQQYAIRMKNNITNKKIQENIKKGEYMHCLKCNTLLKKVSGCNWIQCSTCKLELCWVLKTYRWGPGGRGDTSGGCKCGLDRKKCSPLCTSSCTPHGYII